MARPRACRPKCSKTSVQPWRNNRKSQKMPLESCSVNSTPTWCFVESDVLFCWKRCVVLLKTTCCFVESDVLFWWKRRVVLLKLTCRFWWTIRSSICPIGKRKSVRMDQSSEIGIFCVKIPIIVPLARTRTLQEFYCFCCHKCHTVVCKRLYYRWIKFTFGVF